jgi:MFS family permease
MAWHHEINREQWLLLFAAQLGWMLDAMDVMLYSFALTAIRSEFGLSSAAAGVMAAAPLVTSVIGGAVFGYLSDRFGRARTLGWSILAFSFATALTATSHGLADLLLWRALVGIGMGGEWAAGAALVAENWPAQHRAKGIGLMQAGWAIGYLVAAVLAALILPVWGWRTLFLLGVLPTLFTWWIRRNVPEPRTWMNKDRPAKPPIGMLLRPPLRRAVILFTAIAGCLLFGYWGLFTWIPTYLSTPIEHGGAGLSIVRSSAWIVPMQVGSFFGYVLFGFFADRAGRRPAFFTYVLAIAILAPLYGQLGRSAPLLLALGPLVGFFGHGYFSVFGVMMAETFPAAVRTTAQGFCYSAGRAMSGVAPVTIGTLADRFGIGAALAFTSVFFCAAAGLMLLLPETRGEDLA